MFKLLSMLTNEMIERRPAEKVRRGDWYAEVLAAGASEGLSLPEIATRIGVSDRTLYSWRRRFGGNEVRATNGSKRGKAPSLVRVSVREREEGGAGGGLRNFEVHLGSSRKIGVPEGFDVGELQRLVLALEGC